MTKFTAVITYEVEVPNNIVTDAIAGLTSLSLNQIIWEAVDASNVGNQGAYYSTAVPVDHMIIMPRLIVPSGNNEPQVEVVAAYSQEQAEHTFEQVYGRLSEKDPSTQFIPTPDDLDRLIEEDSEDEEFRNAYEEAIQKVRTNITRRQREALQQVPGEVLEDQQEALDRFGSGDDELIEDVDFVDHVNERINRDSSDTFEDVSGLEEYNDEPPDELIEDGPTFDDEWSDYGRN